jgi:hypothetical protein
MILLFKINLLSSLINLYRSFVINDVSIKILKMDSVLFYIKYIVIAINKASHDRNLLLLNKTLESSQSW